MNIYIIDLNDKLSFRGGIEMSYNIFNKMSNCYKSYLTRRIKWDRDEDPCYPFITKFESEECKIRINDFPENQMYSLIINGKEILSFDDWPSCWEIL